MMTGQQWRKRSTSSICLLCRQRFYAAQALHPQRLRYSSASLRPYPLPTTSKGLTWGSLSPRSLVPDAPIFHRGLRGFHKTSAFFSQDGPSDGHTTSSQPAKSQPWSIGNRSSWGGAWGAPATSQPSVPGPTLKKNSDGDGGLLPHEKMARDRARLKTAPLQATAPKHEGSDQSHRPIGHSSDADLLSKRSPKTAQRESRARSHGTSATAGFKKAPSGSFYPSVKSQELARTSSRIAPLGPPSPLGIPRVPQDKRAEAARRTNARFNALNGLDGTKSPLRPQPGLPKSADFSRSPLDSTQEWGQLTRRRSGPATVDSTDASNTSHRRRPEPRRRVSLSDNTLRKAGPDEVDNDAFAAQFEGRIVDDGSTNSTRARADRNTSWDHRRSPPSETRQVVEQDRQNVDIHNFTAASSSSPSPPQSTDLRSRDRDRDRLEKPKKKTRPQRRDSALEDDDDDDNSWLRAEERRRRKAERQAEKERELAEAAPTPILLPEFISVSNLAGALGVKSELFIEQLGELGFENINYDTIMTGETAALVAGEYGFEPTVDTGRDVDLKTRPLPSDLSSLPARPPIVTIMGHVDHGKTTMLDWLRKSSVAAQEHGGITQHIGAFSVRLSTGKQITFLDTPGHAAFLTMRQRGANVTDIVILVVAADDSVKPQTLEALKHARAAKVPIIVAINKIDKDQARVDHVKADLARHGIEIEDFGGDVQVVCVSGKTGQGMSDLEENILTLSEILDVRAETDGMAEGWILEASIKPTGKVATVLVKRGTLRIGDYVVAGTTWAKIRALRNEAGVAIKEAPPGTAVEVLGWKDPPFAGDEVLQAPNESKAKAATHYREEIRDRESAVAIKAAQEQQEREKAEKEELGDEEEPETEESGTKIVNFVVKGDVVGSVEAVCAAVMEIGNNEVRPKVLRSSAGQITEFDVDHAATSGSIIINFNNPIAGFIKHRADDAGVKILDHNVIYHLTDEVKDKLSDQLQPLLSTRVVGEAEVLQVFPINLKARVFKNIAGSRVRNGQISKTAKYRVIRNGASVFEGSLDSLKHGKKDVQEMKKGSECGISFEGWDDIQQGDQVQAYEEIQEKRHL